MSYKRNIIIIAISLLILLVSCSQKDELDKRSDESSSESTEEAQDLDNKGSLLPNYKVVIDAGHGGDDVGSVSVRDRYEKVFTLGVALEVEKLLEEESDIEVYMTRTDDEFISQESEERPKMANRLDADMFVSIHGNNFEDSEVSGTETFYYDEESSVLAEIMQESVSSATQFIDRGISKGNFFVLRDTYMPAVLIEVGYLTNADDEAEMFKEGFQKRVAGAIVDGIKTYITEY